MLKTNYRSAQRIVSHGRRLIEWNSERVAKDFAARAGAPIGKISLRTAPGLQAQADLTAKWLCEEDGYTAERGLQHEWAILVRQNGEARRIAATLKRLSLPFFGIKMMNMILSQYHPDT